MIIKEQVVRPLQNSLNLNFDADPDRKFRFYF